MKTPLPSDLTHIAATFGQNLKEARLARNWTQQLMAERMGVSALTLKKMEKGDTGVAFGSYLIALDIFGLANQVAGLAAAHTDEEGRRLRMFVNKRARQRAQ